jgi:L-alanine-DL-glutamate epimerase-like enolase superfamily enzyme
MKIRSVRAFLLCYPFRAPIQLAYYGGERRIVKRDAMLIRVETDSGLTGYAPGQGSEKAHRIIEGVVAPFLEGKTLADPDALRVLFALEPGIGPAEMKVYCSAEVALYDLAGKAAGVPASELLGGRVRDTIALYSSAGMYMPPEGYAREAAQAKAMGFHAYKMRPALGPEKDLEAVARMREATGPDFDLMVDAHTWWRMGDRSYSAGTVERLAGEMTEYDIAWLEEPMPPDDHAAYHALKQKNLAPLASGEHEPSEEGFLDLVHGDCVDYVQMDLVCQGGYSDARRLFAEVARAGLAFAFHSWGTALEVLAAAQLGICWPESVVQWLEYPVYTDGERQFMYEFPLAAEILKEPLEIRDGYLVVPRKPGLGIDVDESVIERYPWISGPWSYFSLISPPETYAVTSDHSVKWTGAPGG